MLQLTDLAQSYWLDDTSSINYDPIKENYNVDVGIVGGGIMGLTAAYMLKMSGLNVAVLEKNTLGSGTTGHTTGKVTSQHNLVYSDLLKRFGHKTAKIYGESNQSAIETIQQIIKKGKIDCGWQRDDNFVFTTSADRVQEFKREARDAAELGLPASFETKTRLPFKIEGAVKFANQAKLHATKYVRGLAVAVQGNGSYVFEHSNVTGIHDGNPASIKANGVEVTAKNIIVATKVPTSPLVARFSYATLEYPHTSYIVAGPVDYDLKGMYISPDKGQYSLLPVNYGKDKLLLIGGLKHIPGLGSPSKRHQKLAGYGEKYFNMTNVAYRWKGMDYLAYDGLPLIGKVYPWSKHIYTATGFKKWGLSNSVVAATILHDKIVGNHNPWYTIYDSTRLKPVKSIPYAVYKYFK